MSTTPPRRLVTLTGLAATALVLAACGGGDADDAAAPAATATGGGAGELDQVTVGIIPIADVVPLHMGMEAGIFEDHGIELELVAAQGGAAIIPAVVSDEFQFGYSNPVSLLIAHDTGVGTQVVSNGSTSSNEPGNDVTEVAAIDESIQSVEDLEGRTVAINALNNFADTTIRASMEAVGADPSTVDFVEVPYPNMPASLQAGDVDAAWTTEPFRTDILQHGGRIVASPMTDMAENFDSGFYFSSESLVEEDPELVERFVAALEESFALAMEDEEATRQAIAEFTEMDPAVAAEIAMPQWLPEINREGVERLAEAAAKYGTISETPDWDDFYGPAR